MMLDNINEAFREDKRMIEAQHKTIKEQGLNSMVIRHDAGPVQMHRIMDRLSAEETRLPAVRGFG